MTEPMIRVEKLTKRYKKADRNAVDGISLSVMPGELFALLGPNGAGKTTTVAILTTTLAPTSGEVWIAGHSLATDSSAVRSNVGIIFQNPSLDLNLTAEENVRLHAILYGLHPFRPTFASMPRAYQTQVRELAAVLGIEAEIFKPIKTFSGGMKRKLEIIRGLIHRPKVLFLDEPTTGLDPASRRNLWEYLRQVQAASDTTIFLTTHYLEEAEAADTVCIINQGKVVSYGTPAEVKSNLIENYLVIDALDQERLRAELERLGIPFMQRQEPGLGAAPFRILLTDQSPQAIIKAIETPLSVLKTHLPTLEDAYLSILEQK
jgi:ABC-2 type transport system ATP-binding protein